MSTKSPIIEIAKKVCPAVITVIVSKDLSRAESLYSFPFGTKKTTPKFGKSKIEKTQIGGGSGFIVSENGYVLTSNHVVSDVTCDYTVILDPKHKYPVKVLSRNPINDTAVLKIEGDNFPFLDLADSNEIELGEDVVAVGNALGEFTDTLSAGIVSGLSRFITAFGGIENQSQNLRGLIQTDAAINPGNSGGPLFNFKGEVIGINSAILNPAVAMNVGFAIPINLARQIAEQIQRSGKVARGYLGVGTEDMTHEKAARLGIHHEVGALVNVVNPGSPAESAGLRSNDIITDVAGRRIENSAGLQQVIQSRAPKESVEVVYWRSGRRAIAKVQLEENPALAGMHVLGMQLSPLSQSEIAEIGIAGLKIASIDRRSPVSGSLQPGDIVTHVVFGQQAKVATTALLKQLEQKLARGSGGQLVFVRDGYQLVLTLR